MKKVYIAPALEMEIYELNTSIASHCGIVVDNGPEVGDRKMCASYGEINPFSLGDPVAETNSPVYNVQFYDDTNCDCYTTGGDYGYWQS